MFRDGPSMDDLIPIAQAIIGAGCFIAPLMWRLASRLQKMESDQEARAIDVKDKLEGIESDLTMIRDAQEKAGDVERNGRKELWVEVSALRERLVKIETKMTGEC